MLPKTIACTLTAVPRSSGMRSILRYSQARSFIQLRNTASMASRSCTATSCGNATGRRRRRAPGTPSALTLTATIALNSATRSFRSSAPRSVSLATPRACFFDVIAFSNRSPFDVEHDLREHLDEAAVAVPREALVARLGDEALDRDVVEAEVEHGVHHARHRERRPERTETSSGSSGRPASCPSCSRGPRRRRRSPRRVRAEGRAEWSCSTPCRPDR